MELGSVGTEAATGMQVLGIARSPQRTIRFEMNRVGACKKQRRSGRRTRPRTLRRNGAYGGGDVPAQPPYPTFSPTPLAECSLSMA